MATKKRNGKKWLLKILGAVALGTTAFAVGANVGANNPEGTKQFAGNILGAFMGLFGSKGAQDLPEEE